MLSPTTMVDVTYATGAFLAVLGVVVSIWPPRRGWWKAAAVSVFVILACIGGVCVHLTQVAAEIERQRDQEQAQSDQQNLRAEIDRLSKAQAVSLRAQTATAGEITTVRKQTAPLAQSPLPVSIANPETLKPSVPTTSLPSPVSDPVPPPVRGLQFSQETIPSDDESAPYAIKVTIQTSVTMQPTSLVINCSTEITGGDYRLVGLAGVLGKTKLFTDDRRGMKVQISQTPFQPETPIVAELTAKRPIRVLSVTKGPL